MRSNGVLGGKITGAGGGGFFLVIAKTLRPNARLMYKLYPNDIALDVKFHPQGTEVLWKNF